MITKICEVCGASFQIKPYRANKARFCSQVCGGKWHMSVRKMPDDHKKGNQFRKGLRPVNAFTSEQVIKMNTVNGEIHCCAKCGKEFEVKPWLVRQNKSKSGKRFCTKSCHSLFLAENEAGINSKHWVGGITTYRGKGWLEARMLAVNRDNGTCQTCGVVISKSISVHHIKPFRIFASVEDANHLDNLICLCQSCHMKMERTVSDQFSHNPSTV